MKSNRFYLLTLLCILCALLPSLFLRDVNSWNELHLLSIAQEAAQNHSIFAFTSEGAPFTGLPPFYLWICTFAYVSFGAHASIMLSLVASLSVLYLIVLFDRACGSVFSHQDRLLTMVGMCSIFGLSFSTIAISGDVFFAAILLVAYVKLIRRYSLINKEGSSKYGNIAIPLIIAFAIFVKGLFALAFPVLALFMLMIYRRDLRRFFVVFRPYYFIIILFCLSLWFGGLTLEVGYDQAWFYITRTLSTPFVASENTLVQPDWYYLAVFPLLLLPLPLTFLYFTVRAFFSKQQLGLRAEACFFFTISVFIIISCSVVKVSSYALPAIPTIYYFILYCYREILHPLDPDDEDDEPVEKGIEFIDHSRSWIIKEDRPQFPRWFFWSLALPLLVLMLLFVAYFVFYSSYSLLQDSFVGIACCILGFISLLSLVLLSCRFFILSLAVEGLAVLSFIFCLGWAMPHLNNYMGLGNMAHILSKSIDAGGSAKVCVYKCEEPRFFKIYDPRFEIIDFNSDTLEGFDDCLASRANIVFTHRAQQLFPEATQTLIKDQAVAVGYRYVLPSTVEYSSLPTKRQVAALCDGPQTEECCLAQDLLQSQEQAQAGESPVEADVAPASAATSATTTSAPAAESQTQTPAADTASAQQSQAGESGEP